MHKYVYFVESYLTSTLGYGGNTASVEQSLWDTIQSILAEDDWTYLKISFAGHTEIVKVVGSMAPSSLILVREQDNTVRSAFPVGSVINYVQTSVGILDSFSPSKLSVDTLGAIVYAGGTITMPEVRIIGLGGVGIPNSAALRCCPIDDAPEIPLDLEPLRIDSADNVRVTSDDEYRVWI